jgi:hypothetical protein
LWNKWSGQSLIDGPLFARWPSDHRECSGTLSEQFSLKAP